ncbi:hypothetical protein ACRALDRAFT_213525 [Sodiomyces alcalophilus JCM 7366]|uniref:uncharacterized protein n=1 Tax=Sodiomyces alcalophilus JCM 7366 TaxID=591952 RepID=UPI0039B47F57
MHHLILSQILSLFESDGSEKRLQLKTRACAAEIPPRSFTQPTIPVFTDNEPYSPFCWNWTDPRARSPTATPDPAPNALHQLAGRNHREVERSAQK